MPVFDGVSYSLSPSLSPTRRTELAAVLDLNGAAPHPPYTHLVAPAASHAHTNATANNPDLKLVTDRWVDRSVVMGKRQSEQYYSPDPAMIFSGVVACATDLSAPDLEVLSAGITALGGQWRVGLTRDVTHLFALRAGSDKYNTALHFAPQTHMCILTPHWFDDAVRLGRRIPETPYTWPDPLVLSPGVTLDLDDDALGPDGKRRRKHVGDTAAAANDGSNDGEHVRVWDGRRILLSTSLALADGSRRAIEARVQRAGGVVVPMSENADEDTEEKVVDEADVLVTRWRGGKSYFKAARASLLIGTLSWLFSVESSGTLHSPLDSLLWYPTPRGGIPDLVDCEISVTNYTGAARDYLKRLIILVGAKFTPSMSQTNKVLIAGFQPSPKTTRALSWSIPVVNHTWLEDCFVEWRALTVGLERYIVYPPGVDFGTILMTRQDGPASSQSKPQRLSGGAVPGGRGMSSVDLEQEEARDAEYHARARGALGHSTVHDAFERATTADGMSVVNGDASTELQARPWSRAGSVKKTPTSARARRASTITGPFSDHVIELPADDDVDAERRTPAKGKQGARATSVGSRAPSSAGLFSTARDAGDSGGKSRDGDAKDKGKSVAKQQTRPTMDVDEDEDVQLVEPLKVEPRAAQRRPDVRTAQTDEAEAGAVAKTREPRRGAAAITSIPDLSDGESVPPRRRTGTGSRTPVKSGMKPRPRSQSQSRPPDGEDEEARVAAVETGPATGNKKRREEVAKATHSGGVVSKSKGKEKEKEKSAGRKETKPVAPRPRSPSRSPSPASLDTKIARPTKRQLSVVVPSVPPEYFSSQEVHESDDEGPRGRETGKKGAPGATSGTKPKPLGPAASTRAVAHEVSTSTGKRGRPSLAKTSGDVARSGKSKAQPQPKAKPKPKPKPGPSKAIAARADDDESMDGDGDASVIIVDAPATSTSRGGPRRSAANKATARLREVMPDVVSFEKEQKQAKRRRSTGEELDVSVRENEASEERRGKKRKVAREEEEEEVEVEDVVLVSSVKPKSKPNLGKGRAKGTMSVGSDEEMDNPSTKTNPGGSKGGRGRAKEPASIRVMTTGVSLLDDVIKRITKLGVQMTTKPTDCTHLIAKGIVRTEKFLCAMSVTPYILTEDWANASARSGKLLPEQDYLLSDPTAEQKWAFKFADAMARAEGLEGGSNLFKEMTFYVTPKVSVDAKLLKNVVSAGGGQVQISTTPTVRILNGKANRYVISCQEDKGIWRPLAQEGFKVYSPELVLRGALRQEIEWEKQECLVTG